MSIENALHGLWAIYIRGILSLHKRECEKSVVRVSVGEKDVFWPLFVHAETCVEEEVELGDDEGCVPCGAGSARENEVVVWFGEFPF